MERGTESSPILLTARMRKGSSPALGKHDEDTVPESQWCTPSSEWKFEGTLLPPACPGLLLTEAQEEATGSLSVELDSDFADEMLTRIY
jgi:hypothetical protein